MLSRMCRNLHNAASLPAGPLIRARREERRLLQCGSANSALTEEALHGL